MLPGLETLACPGLAVPQEVMHHVVRIESSFNPYAIGVVGGRLVRQPKTLTEALSTVRMLEQKGYNFSIGLAQVNRYNLDKYGLPSYEKAFEPCANLVAGSRILAECYSRSGGDWGKSFSCYYSGNFSTGFRHGYVQKIYASIRQGREVDEETPNAQAIAVVGRESRKVMPLTRHPLLGGEVREGVLDGQPQLGFSDSAIARRPSRAEAVVSRRIAVENTPSQAADPANITNQVQPMQVSAPLQTSPQPAAQPARESLQQAAAQPVATADRARSPVVLQPYTSPSAASPTALQPAPRVSVPPVDRAPRKSDEAFVF